MTEDINSRCAAAQAHKRLAAAAASLLRGARNDLRDGFRAAAQNKIDLSRDVLGLTSMLYTVLNSAPPSMDNWSDWVARVRGVASDAHLTAASLAGLKVLLEAILVVRWGDHRAMLVSSLPSRARARGEG